MKYQELISGLKKGAVLPLYLFYGEEEFLIQEALDLIVERVADPGARDFNFNSLYCKETPASEIVNLAQTLPFMSDRRLVIAKGVDAFKASELEELLPYLNDPSPSTCLVLVSHEAKYEKKPVIAAVEAHGAVVRSFPLLDRDVAGWIESRVKTTGATIQHEAAVYLQQVIGNDLQKIKNELEKVRIYIKDRKAMTYEDVKAVAGDFREYTAFDLAAALGRKNGETAFLILSRLLQEGEAPVAILGSIAWNYRRLFHAKALEAAGLQSDDILKKLRIIFHQTALFKEQMKRYSLDELREAFSIMLKADRSLKSGSLNGRLVLERMIVRLCGENGA